MFKSLITRVFPILIISTLTACGGSGGGSDSAPTPTLPTKSATILVQPNYTGTRELKVIAPDQAAHLALDLTVAFDLLHVISFSDVYEHFLIHTEDDVTSDQSSDINCASGSASTKEVSSTHIEVSYNQCAQGGVVANGMLDIYVTRIYDSALMDMNIIPNLSMVDRATGESININGYIQVREANTSDFIHKATYQILLTNEANEQIYFKDFTAQVSLWGDRYGIDYSGEILSTEYGKLSVETTKLYNSNVMDFGFDLTVSAENTTLLSVILGKQLKINADPESIPLIIDLNNIPNSFFDGVNEAPEAELVAEVSSSDRMSNVSISAIGSIDQDLDLLTYRWTVISSPENSTWSIDDNASANFSANLPGLYTIQLTVTDPQGLTSSVTTDIKIEKSAPEFSISMTTDTVPVNTVAYGQVTLTNDGFDGPFEYHIVYGPYGLTIDAEGQIQWPAHIMDFGSTTEVNFAIAVSNSDKTTTVDSALSVTSSANFVENIVFNDIRQLLPTAWYKQKQVFSHQSKEQLLSDIDSESLFSSHVFLNEENIIDVKLVKSSLPEGYSYAASFDANEDGILDHFLASDDYIDGNSYWNLWLEDGLSGERIQVLSIDGHSGTSTNFGYFTFEDIDDDGELEMTISTHLNYGEVRQVRSYDLASFELENIIETINGEHVGYCDIDQDGFNDVITSKEIYSLKSDELIAKIENAHNKIQLIETGNRCLLVTSSHIYKFENEELLALPVEIDENFFVGNFDNDPDKEVLFAKYQSGSSDKWSLGNIDSNGNLSTTSLFAPDDIYFEANNSNHGFHGILSVLDFNGDGIDELLAFGTHTNNQGLSAISVQGNNLVEKYSGTTFDFAYDQLKNIAQYHDDNSVTVNTENAAIRLGDESNWINFDNASGWTAGEILATEVINDELFYYASLPVPTYEDGIAKYDSDGIMLWSNSTSITWFDQATLTQDNLLVQRGGTAYIVDKATGEASLSSFGNLISSPKHFSFQLFLDTNAYVFYQLADKVLSTVLGNENFEFWGNNLNIPLQPNVQFVQYDNDPQIEVIFNYYVTGEDGSNIMKYDIVDGLTWKKEILTPGLSGYQSSYEISRELQTCFITDNACRNKIISPSNHIEIRDKLTNELIYQSPQYSSRIKDLATKSGVNGQISFSLLMNNNSVTTFH